MYKYKFVVKMNEDAMRTLAVTSPNIESAMLWIEGTMSTMSGTPALVSMTRSDKIVESVQVPGTGIQRKLPELDAQGSGPQLLAQVVAPRTSLKDEIARINRKHMYDLVAISLLAMSCMVAVLMRG